MVRTFGSELASLKALVLLGVAACGGLSQAPECAKFLSCTSAVSPMSQRVEQPTYGPGGTCWQNPSDAEACTDICKKAVEALQMGPGASHGECK
jgi:hypothetical protein